MIIRRKEKKENSYLIGMIIKVLKPNSTVKPHPKKIKL
jgi:hypothetical protein